MKFVNKNSGDVISFDVYNQLDKTAQVNFIPMSASQPAHTSHTSHQTVRHEDNHTSIGDVVGGVAAAAVIVPLAIVDSVFSIFD